MSDIAVRVEHLGKLYRLGQTVGYKTLRDTLTNVMAAPFRRSRAKSQPTPGSGEGLADGHKPDHIWALDDVSFEIKRGEAVGIIGRNGSGKSTLLKILSRITVPTRGYAEIQGRVGSLLEVGTGFHAELTGRENIYFNGVILGMKKTEIDRKLDEIVAFSEIEGFLDTPVKRYSSGMYVRLAFAVAAHLEPDIMLVDEVLAVGDAEFQKKCLGKMEGVTREGRTVLFVSHNLGSLINLCPRALLLVQGVKSSDGPSTSVVNEYVSMMGLSQGERIWNRIEAAPGNENVRLHAVRVVSSGVATGNVDIQNDIQVEIEYWNLKSAAHICVSIHLLDQLGIGVLASANMHSANLLTDRWFGKPYPLGLYRTICTIPGNFLNEGRYSINAIVLTDVTNVQVFARDVISFTVSDTGAMRKEYGGSWLGVVRPKLAWQTEYRAPLNDGSGERQ